jgi:ActR/RegA family two-component response regulator
MLIVGSDATRRRLRALLEASGTAQLVADVGSSAAAFFVLRGQLLEAAVLDLRLWDGDAKAVVEEVKRTRPGCVVIVLTDFGSLSFLERCRELEADYFLDEAADLEAVPRILSNLKRPAEVPRPAPGAPGPAPVVQTGWAIRVVGEEAVS